MLSGVQTVLVIDWPSRDVPERLARAGLQVLVKGGPGPTDYSVYEVREGAVVPQPLGRAPEHADLIYSYRPLSELPGIVEMAQSLGAKTIWLQSGKSAGGANDPKGCWIPDVELRQARAMVQSAGLQFVSEPYIGDAVPVPHG